MGAATLTERDISEPTTPALVERGHELGVIDAALTAASEGVGRVVVLEGPAGIGKTRLLAAASAMGPRLDATVLRARGGELERDFAFGIARQLLEPPLAAATASRRRQLCEGVAGQAVRSLQLHPAGQRSDPLQRPSGSADPTTSEGSAAIVHGLYWLVATLAERTPLFILVDDVHWADSPSWRFLAYLARRLEDLAVALVLATRTGEAGGDVSSLAASMYVEMIALQPLSGTGAAELVRHALGGAVAPEFSDACHVASAGNPFLLTELIAQLRQGTVDPTARNAARVSALRPASVARSVLANVAQLGHDAGDLARAVAVLGTGAEPRWARLLAGLDREQAAAATDRLAAANVLSFGESLEFTHPLVQATIHDSIPPARRALAHAEAARVLRRDGADADRVAAQLLLADAAGDEQVVATLCDAAEGAERRGAPDVAVRYLMRALQEPPAQADTPAIMRALGRARLRAGAPGGIDDLVQARAATQDPIARAGIALELGRGMMMVDRSTEALDLFTVARGELGDADPALGALLDAEEVGSALLDVSTAKRAIARLANRFSDLPGDSLGERLLLAYGAFIDAARGAPAADVAGRAQRALAHGDLAGEETIAAFCFAVFVLSFSDRTEGALGVLDAAIAQARDRGSSVTFSLASWMRSHAHYRRGELADAEADAQAALDANAEGWFTAPVGFLVDALIERGDLEAAQDAFDAHGLTDGLFPNLLVANLLLDARGRLRCAQGRFDQGLTDLLAVGERLAAWETTNPAVIQWRSSAALAYVALGDLGAARRLSDEEVGLARAFGAPRALGVALRAAGLVQPASAGIELLREAVSVLERPRARLEYARALTDLGAALRRRGRRTDARDPLRQGLDLANQCGAGALAARAREELITTGARPRRERLSGAQALTASERRIATLAASGMTNREIAQALFITVKTVKAHLGHVFQKLDISERGRLADALTQEATSTR